MQFIFMWSYQARFQNFIQNCTFVVISFVRLTLCKFFCYLINQFLNSSFCFFFYRGKFIAWLVYRDRSTNLHLLLKFSAEDLSFELEQHPTSYCYIHLNAVCVWFRRKRLNSPTEPLWGDAWTQPNVVGHSREIFLENILAAWWVLCS